MRNLKMSSTIVAVILMVVFTVPAFAQQAPDTLWTQAIGGDNQDVLYDVEYGYGPQGGFVAVGTESDYIYGESQMYVVRFDDYQNIIWSDSLRFEEDTKGHDIESSWYDQGYVVVASSSEYLSQPLSSVHLIRFDSDGDTLWTKTYGNYELSSEVRVTRCGNPYGYAILTWDYDNYGPHVIKTDLEGDVIWAKTFDASQVYGHAIVNLYSNGLIVGGSKYSYTGNATDFYFARLGVNGDTIWTKTYGSERSESIVDMDKTPEGALIAVGNSSASGEINQTVLMKVDTAGDTLWTRTFGTYQSIYAKGVRVDFDGGFLISGYTSSISGMRPTVIKTNEEGYIRWISEIYCGPGGGGTLYDVMPSYMGGYITVGDYFNYSYTDMWMAKLESDPSSPVTVTLFDPPNVTLPFTGGEFEFTVTVTNNGDYTQYFDVWMIIDLPNVGQVPIQTITGLSLGEQGSITKTLTQNVPYSAPGGEYTYNVYVGNYPWQISFFDSFTFYKDGSYGDGGGLDPAEWLCEGWFETEEDEITASIPETNVLLPNYPNPFNPTTNISFSLAEAGYVNLTVYDISGRQVATLVDGYRDVGQHEFTFDATELTSGVYFCRIKAGDYSTTEKMMLVK